MEISPASLDLFRRLLHERTGQVLSPGRNWRIETALKPLLRDHNFESIDALADAIMAKRGDALVEAVIDAMLNNETSFFRDAAVFRLMIDEALQSIAPSRAAARRLRIWCAGCSTGQEAYTVAMMLAGGGSRWAGWTIDILGTDVSAAAITQARSGVYSQFEIQRGLPVREMMRWFDGDEERWRANAELRQRCRFERHNLLMPPPAGARFDVILCRNVLLYLGDENRRRVFQSLAGVVAPDGVLMLGAGETVLGQTEAFVPDPEHRGIYRPQAAIQHAMPARRAAG